MIWYDNGCMIWYDNGCMIWYGSSHRCQTALLEGLGVQASHLTTTQAEEDYPQKI